MRSVTPPDAPPDAPPAPSCHGTDRDRGVAAAQPATVNVTTRAAMRVQTRRAAGEAARHIETGLDCFRHFRNAPRPLRANDFPMPVRVDIISIGTLSRNRLWNETAAVRTPHATTTLLRSGKAKILVDPGLPAVVAGARLYERSGLRPEQITAVFLTNFRPAHRDGLAAFPNAKWLLHEVERDAVRHHLLALRERGDKDVSRVVETELALLDRTRGPDDKLADQIDLFPLPGYTPGGCGLLVAEATTTTLIAGDAVPTREHLLAAQILPDAVSVEAAQEAMREVYEIADVIVPGHDNLFLNPRGLGG